MARRLIIDTGLLITAERGRSQLTRAVNDDDDVAIAAVTAAELLTGVELASPEYRAARTAYVDQLLSVLPIELYDLATARHHASLIAHVTRSGTRRGAHDLLIAATARATGRAILTADRSARFDELPGVEALVVAS